MRILLLTHSFNSLAQRLFVVLGERGHMVSVELDISDAVTEEAVALFRPDLIIAPFLKRAIAERVWRTIRCLIVHPGPPGDRGPSALDWAILEDAATWGITVLEAEAELDAGPAWASATFPMRHAAKSSLYRREVADAAERAVLAAIERLAAGAVAADGIEPPEDAVVGRPHPAMRPAMRQADRAIDWQRDDTATVLRKSRSGDGRPGVRDRVLDLPVWLYDAYGDPMLGGPPGAIIGRRETAICRATADGAVWLGQLRRREAGVETCKLPATLVLGERLAGVREVPEGTGGGWRDLWYEEAGDVGVLHFPFYNGAMSVRQCERLRAAWAVARRRPTRVLVLAGGPDFWSNGMHLNVIEAADSPADESWRTINAIDDVVRDILLADDKMTIAALQGNAGAGGVFLALAADRVVARHAIVLNPHYTGMGNLYGSEYWTYLLPRRVGPESADILTRARLPMGTREAARLGLVDEVVDGDPPAFLDAVLARAQALAADPALPVLLRDKVRRRAADERARPLESYRAAELERMRLNFYGFDPSYHVARYNFVMAVPKSRTPHAIALHRRGVGGAAAQEPRP